MDTKKLRQKILDLAIQGKLVPQDPNDEPASVLLERIRVEKERLIAEGKIKRSKKSASSDTSHYENVPFDVPENWLSVKVEDVCIFESGFAFSSESYKATGQPLVRISNIKEGFVDLDGCVYVDPVEDPRFEVNSGDLLIAMSGATTGKMGIYKNNSPALLNQRVGNIKTISHNILLSEYRNLIMQSLEPQIIKDAYGGAQPNISAKNICAYRICLPPLQEQQRIVNVVEQWFSLIDSIETGTDKLKQNISKAKSKILDLAIHGKLVPQDANDEPASELLKRINPKAVASCDNPHYADIPFEVPEGWCWTTIGDVMTLKSGTNIKVRECNTSGDYPVYGGNGINGTYKEYNVQPNTIIIGRVGFYCGSVNITESKAWVTDNALIVSCMDVFEPRFLLYLLQYMDLGKTSNSTAQPVVSGKGILPLLIPIPPIKEQERIVTQIERLMCSLDSIAESLN